MFQKMIASSYAFLILYSFFFFLKKKSQEQDSIESLIKKLQFSAMRGLTAGSFNGTQK